MDVQKVEGPHELGEEQGVENEDLQVSHTELGFLGNKTMLRRSGKLNDATIYRKIKWYYN